MTSRKSLASGQSSGVSKAGDPPLMGPNRLADAMQRTGRGDRSAFDEVYALTSCKLFGICLRICREYAVAEDILHDVYLTVWRRAASWDPCRGSAITWLATIARNRSIDWRRSQLMIPTMVPVDDRLEIVDPSPDAESLALSNDLGRQLQLSFNALEPRAREAIRAAFFGGLTYAEVARLHDVPLGTMKSCVRRGLTKIRSDLERATVA